ncbi:MAG: sulfotransferase [Actinomycetia bacterium]|nr:sulfotransferase [Actinomycetes bacterium]
MPSPVCIVGQYKCGTSWLLAALSAHPEVVGAREVDLVRAFIDVETGADLPPSERVERLFGSSAWSPQPVAEALAATTAEGSADHGVPLRFTEYPTDAASQLAARVSEGDAHSAAASFVDALAGSDSTLRPVLKAADQIAVFEHLPRLYPDASAVVITRDGRDAALAAVAYRSLMADQSAPWYKGPTEFDKQLSAWRSRARMVIAAARNGEIHLIRYEDLTHEFSATFGRLLEHLDLDHDDELVARIEALVAFENVTGRSRGTEAAAVVRRGLAQGWVDDLDSGTAEAAWGLAGEELAALGYTADGGCEALAADVAGR